jgi:hypothetical protein
MTSVRSGVARSVGMLYTAGTTFRQNNRQSYSFSQNQGVSESKKNVARILLMPAWLIFIEPNRVNAH